MPTLSALMSVYHATDAAELELTLNSLDAQTRPADEVVVVFDGEVSGAVRGVVAKHGARVVELPENVGLGRALNAGLATINATYTARIDSDDAAKPERFAKQLAYLEAHPDVAALGSAMEEFEHTPGDRGTIRALPRDPNAYVKINLSLIHI